MTDKTQTASPSGKTVLEAPDIELDVRVFEGDEAALVRREFFGAGALRTEQAPEDHQGDADTGRDRKKQCYRHIRIQHMRLLV